MDSNSELILLGGIGPAKTEFYDQLDSKLIKKCRFVKNLSFSTPIKEIHKKLADVGIRAETDLRNEKINYKIREHSRAKVPVMFIVGRQEMEKGTVAQRVLAGKDQEFLALDDAVNRLLSEAKMPG